MKSREVYMNFKGLHRRQCESPESLLPLGMHSPDLRELEIQVTKPVWIDVFLREDDHGSL